MSPQDAHSAPDTSERFLVTGSEGCIGAWTVRNLVLAGYPTVAVDVSAAGKRLYKVLDESRAERVTHEVADLCREGELARLVDQYEVTRIVHLAALQVPFVAANPVLGSEVNVVGTTRVLEAARSVHPQVRGVSYASSAAAIGPDASPEAPDTLYGVFKLCNEHTARIYARDYQTPSIGLRPCVVYGAARDQGMTAALTHALKAAVLGVAYRIPFGGRVDVQYARDVAAAFISSALAENTGADVYDLHGEAVTVADFVDTISSLVPSAQGLITFDADRTIPGSMDNDDSALSNRLGGLPKTSLLDGILESLEMFGRHRDSGVLTVDDLPTP